MSQILLFKRSCSTLEHQTPRQEQTVVKEEHPAHKALKQGMGSPGLLQEAID